VTKTPTNRLIDRDYLPPLLRGLGTTVVLIGTVVALVTARRDLEQLRSRRQASPLATAFGSGSQPTLALVAKELQELRGEEHDDNIVEEVFENRWFEWLGLLGAGLVSGSFYVETFLRRSKSSLEKKGPANG
jgi:hypothetical protein